MMVDTIAKLAGLGRDDAVELEKSGFVTLAKVMRPKAQSRYFLGRSVS